MKRTCLMLTIGSLLAMVISVHAQNGPGAQPVKPLYNPMYSPHNYKHPNMAAAARRWESQSRGGVVVQKAMPADIRLSNYKRPMPLAQPVGSIMLPHTPSISLADRNYKIQRLRVPTPAIDMKEYYTEPRKINNTTVGE